LDILIVNQLLKHLILSTINIPKRVHVRHDIVW